MKNLIQQLKYMNFNEYEAKAYISLVKLGTVTAYQVSKDSGVPRARIYEILDVLVEKGIVIKEEIDESIQYSPLPVDVFLQTVQKSWTENFKELQNSLKDLEKVETLPANRVMTLKEKDSIISYCRSLINKATKRIIISMWDDMYEVLKEDLEEAEKSVEVKGLTIHVEEPISQLESHRPTQFTETLTSEHWFILSIDAQEMIYGPSLEARSMAFYTNDPVHIYLLEDYIWHDVLVNRIVKRSNEDLDQWISKERNVFFNIQAKIQ
ncbi:MAG TPA: helix-turn-helix domain-containing protein [Ureibacillus sp.]|nr:helix-turn-helix domain-containing protein [Ureibacillus sp.]